MNNPGHALNVGPALTLEDLREGLAFVEMHYQRVFGLSPSPPDHLIIARNTSRIVGAIGVNVWQPDMGLRLARLYQFAPTDAPLPIDLPHTAEFGRWACDEEDVSGPLLHAAVCFALSHQKIYAWCEHTTTVNRACRRFGVVFHEVINARIDPSGIEECHRRFYQYNHTHLYMIELEQARIALETYLKHS